MGKFACKGTELLLKTTAATPTFGAVGQLQEIGGIDVSADELEVTTLDAGDYRDFIQGFKDAGESQLNVIFDPAFAAHGTDADGLYGIFGTGETRDWAIKMNSSAVGGFSYGAFPAFIRDWSFGAWNPDDAQTAQPTLRLRGPIAITDTAPVVALGGPGTRAAADARGLPIAA